MSGGIIIVIYVDVLFVINFFITFLLLEITARLTKKEAKLYRILLSSGVVGVYSLIILADIPSYVSVLSRFAAACVMLLVAFKFYRVKSFAASLAVFLFSNLLFLGIIVGIIMLFESDMIAVNNSAVYFNIGARGLMVCAFAAYVISSLIVRLYNRKVAAGELYTLKIESKGKTAELLALSDTGNKLREPFSNAPVITADSKSVCGFFDGTKMRLIPASTVSSDAYLKAFKPDRVIIKANGRQEIIENVYVAASDNMKNGGFSAVFNPEILSL